MNLKNRLITIATIVIAIVSIFVTANAQAGVSSVNGTVNDQQGNAIAGATVTLINSEKGFSRSTVTSDNGTYVFTSVPPETYRLEVETKGFKKAVVASVIAQVDTPKTVDVALEIGQVSESVTITSAGEAPLNTTDATLGNTFTSQQVIQLPLSARNTADLLSLQPGVTPDNGSGEGGSVNGGRSDQANVTLDGVDVNEQQGGKAFFSVLRVTPESLQEFRVTTTNANADQGRSSGAQISLVTRGGSNDWHGSGYYYFRPSKKFQANDFFNNQAGVAQPERQRKNYGGSILGPIIKNKLFFSFFYERFEENAETPVTTVVPLASLGQGIVRYRNTTGASDPNCPAGLGGAGITCLNTALINQYYIASTTTPDTPLGFTPGVNPIALQALAAAAGKYKSNTTGGDGLNTGGYRFNSATPLRRNTFTGRFDYKATGSQDIFLRYQYQKDQDITGASAFQDTLGLSTWSHPYGIAAGHIWTINSHMVNRFTYGLTREAFTQNGDSTDNRISFRYVFAPTNFNRTVARTTPIHNFVDDFNYVKGNHTLGFGANVRLISNKRTTYGSSFDTAVLNPSYYDASGAVVLFVDGDDTLPIFPDVSGDSEIGLRDALTSVIGRYSQLGANLQYDASGKLLPPGTGVSRNFKTQEYEAYAQDSWRIRNNLTVNYGVRWSTSTPIYEANGIEVKPTTSLSDFFAKRIAAMNNGTAYNGLISVDLAGKANGKTGYYSQDWNNFAPSVSAAWSPNFKGGFLKTLFGGDNKSTVRGGFRMTYDRIGSALAVAFDLNSTLGFSSSSNTSANDYNVSDRLGPLFTGFNQNIRSLPDIPSYSQTLTFPLQTPADGAQRIEQSLDDKLQTPYHYTFNLSYGREIWKGITVEASYVGSIGRKLLVSRDVTTFNNLRDPQSGDTFYTAMRKLIGYREANAPITSITDIPWFNKFVAPLAGNYSVCGSTIPLTATQAAYRRIARGTVNGVSGGQCIGGRNTYDFTFIQTLWNFNDQFVHPQYATFAAYSTIGSSDYNAAQISVRKRFSYGLQFDFNYTYAHSLDTASGNEAAGAISSGASLILNPYDLHAQYGSSDFDVRHLINANVIYDLPFGRNRTYFKGINKFADAFLGGWTMTGIYRFNTGFPIGDTFDDGRWATNWNVQSNGVQIRNVQTQVTYLADGPNIFSDPTAAYASYRNAYPGENGDRNVLREPSYTVLDMGLYKRFRVTEKSGLTFRLEVFNVTNTQRFTTIDDRSIGIEPFLHGDEKPTNFGKLTAIQGAPRVVQFALRYDF